MKSRHIYPYQALFLITIIILSLSAYSMSDKEAKEIITKVDEMQRNTGDYTSLCYIKDTEKNKTPKINQALVYRRDEDNKFMILFTKPKEDAGKGYLKIDKNLWNYSPSTGKWERRTEREHLGGTNSRRSDFDESRLAEEFSIKFETETKLGNYSAYIFTLTALPSVDVSYPILKLWIDKATYNILKREEYSLSNKLMRTSFYPRWYKKFSESKKADVWIPEEIHIIDELEKGNSTIIAIKEVDLKALPANMFTKAYVESKSK